MMRSGIVVGLVLAMAATACTRDSKTTSAVDAIDLLEELLGSDVLSAEECAANCANMECGSGGEGCFCGEAGDGTCGDDGTLVCNEETYACDCVPDCEGKECGDDGCGGSCSECPAGSWCQLDGDNTGGECVACQDRCDQLGLDCGLWPTEIPEVPECDCGQCEAGLLCYEGTCDCVPDCDGKDCGGNGCGGECGACAGAQEVCADGECLCQPECDGKICGDDGCGGNCGKPCDGNMVCVDGDCVTCTEDDHCDDGLECTSDLCENGECVYGDQAGPCDDSNKCTDNEGCEAGECVGDPIDCDDGNPCTDDGCAPATGCQYEALSGTDCDGGTGQCVDGECVDKAPVCPDGWTMHAGNCYRPFDPEADEPVAWQDADLLCQGFGGSLASIHDEVSNELVKELVNKTNFTDDTTWIGLNDLALEGAWKWSDGSELVFTAWEGGQPNNWSGCWFGSCPENCVAINDPMIGFGGWNDLECEEEHRFICMKPVAWE
jgi:hypothetical protein